MKNVLHVRKGSVSKMRNNSRRGECSPVYVNKATGEIWVGNGVGDVISLVFTKQPQCDRTDWLGKNLIEETKRHLTNNNIEHDLEI